MSWKDLPQSLKSSFSAGRSSVLQLQQLQWTPRVILLCISINAECCFDDLAIKVLKVFQLNWKNMFDLTLSPNPKLQQSAWQCTFRILLNFMLKFLTEVHYSAHLCLQPSHNLEPGCFSILRSLSSSRAITRFLRASQLVDCTFHTWMKRSLIFMLCAYLTTEETCSACEASVVSSSSM